MELPRRFEAVVTWGVIPLALFCLMSFAGAGAAETKALWQVEWEKTVAAAKKEGQVNVYIGGWGVVLDSGAFQKAYPEIKVVSVASRGGGEIAQRILAERRAGKFLADVSIEGFNSNYLNLHKKAKVFDPVKPLLLLPEVADESKWWQGKHSYLDPEGQYVFRFTGIPQAGGTHYNTKLVNPKELKSFWDLLNPKWKGKIESRDARVPGPGNGALRFFYHSSDLGPNFIRRLYGEMDVSLFRDRRQGTDWLITGKYALCFFCSDIPRSKNQGFPVDTFGTLSEGAGLVSQYGTLAFPNRAPHPNAAKVFINWFLSREGQLALQKAMAKSEDSAPDSLRIDISKEDIPPQDRRIDRVQYLDLDLGERLEMEPILKVLNEVLAKKK